MTATAEDQRLFERFSARFPVKFQYSAHEFGTDVFLRDVSAEGFKFTTKEKLFLQDSVSLLVKLPDSEIPLSLNGRVVWIRTKMPNVWDVGVKFYRVDFMEVYRLYKYVAEEIPS